MHSITYYYTVSKQIFLCTYLAFRIHRENFAHSPFSPLDIHLPIPTISSLSLSIPPHAQPYAHSSLNIYTYTRWQMRRGRSIASHHKNMRQYCRIQKRSKNDINNTESTTYQKTKDIYGNKKNNNQMRMNWKRNEATGKETTQIQMWKMRHAAVWYTAKSSWYGSQHISILLNILCACFVQSLQLWKKKLHLTLFLVRSYCWCCCPNIALLFARFSLYVLVLLHLSSMHNALYTQTAKATQTEECFFFFVLFFVWKMFSTQCIAHHTNTHKMISTKRAMRWRYDVYDDDNMKETKS